MLGGAGGNRKQSQCQRLLWPKKEKIGAFFSITLLYNMTAANLTCGVIILPCFYIRSVYRECSPLRLQKIMHHDYSVTTQKQCTFNIDWRLALSLCRKYNNSQLCWQLHVQRSPMVLMLSQWEPERRVWEFPGIFHRQHLSQWVLPFYSNINKVVHRLRFLL